MVGLQETVEDLKSALTDLLVPDPHNDIIFELDEHLPPGG